MEQLLATKEEARTARARSKAEVREEGRTKRKELELKQASLSQQLQLQSQLLQVRMKQLELLSNPDILALAKTNPTAFEAVFTMAPPGKGDEPEAVQAGQRQIGSDELEVVPDFASNII
jgi:hypothetical protein